MEIRFASVFLGLVACAGEPSMNGPNQPTSWDMTAKAMALAPTFPPGAMIAFAGPLAPDGWWLCDGKAVSSADYPDLFNAIGSSWGDGGDGTGPLFNIPDLRGLFPRGVDAGSKRDPEASSRKPITQGGNMGDRVGSVQEAGTAPPKARFVGLVSSSKRLQPGTGIVVEDVAAAPTNTSLELGGGDSETRPRNAAVNWIVKY